MENRSHDRALFIEIIESFQNVIFLRTEVYQGYTAHIYQGNNGAPVLVEATDLDEVVTYGEGYGILHSLGLGDYVDRLFPMVEQSEEQQNAIVEHEDIKAKALSGL